VEAPSHHFPPNAHITWREFTDTFRGVYIPPGLTEIKLGEFLSLNQDTKTVTQYLHAFNNLSCYASDMVNTNAKKIASFKRGLNPKMMKHMGTNTRTGFNDFIIDCMKQEKNNNVMLHLRLARGPLSKVCPSQEPRWKIVLRIVYLLLV
jgi:hypothetical protein